MYRIFLYTITLLCSLTSYSKHTGDLFFIENKGQVTDQFHLYRPDIQFSLHTPGMNLFIGKGALHYQFAREDNAVSSANTFKALATGAIPTATNIETYRMDVELVGADKNAIAIAEDKQDYYENYYLPQCPNGVRVNTYKKITYKNVYPGIDWVIYIKDNKLEHDFIVKEGGKPSDIQLRYLGASSLTVNTDGTLNTVTPFGTVTEAAPVTYEASGKKVNTSYVLKDGMLGFKLEHYKGELTIDPLVEWATYYGANTSEEYSFGIAADDSGYIYMAGNSSYTAPLSIIATTGAFQTTHAGGNLDAFLVKFDSNGVRQWATYYGGIWYDYRTFVASDHFNGIYILFSSQSPGLATPGSYKDASDGSPDAVLAKFNSNGARVWSTYFGGGNVESGLGIACDQGTHVYISGHTSSPSGVATSGAFLETNADSSSAYLARFDSSGTLLWSTYYGGDTSDQGYSVTTDYAGNVYLSGSTLSDSGIATVGSHQPIYNGVIDLFLVKFDGSGQRQWATYYGGNGYEDVPHVSCDSSNNVYLSSYTNSPTDIASANGWQPAFGGGYSDLFVAKFDASGVRQWGTYYGGSDDDFNFYIWDVGNVYADRAGNCFLVGNTKSNNNIASAGAYQASLGGQDDGFIAMLNPAGMRMFGTYYGGSGKDGCLGITTVGENIYVSGMTRSMNSISTTNSHQPAYGGGISEAFLVKFNKCTAYQPLIAQIDLTLSVDTFLTYQWFYNGTVITGADSQHYTATLDGDYYVVITDSLGCTNISDTISITNTGLHIPSTTADISLYPNPVTGSFILSGNVDANNATIAIADITGRAIVKQEIPVNGHTLHHKIETGSNMPPGVYVLKLVTDMKTISIPFVKQ